MKENEVNVGQTVYFKEHWSGNIYKAKVTNIGIADDQLRNPGKKYAELKCELGTCWATIENIYPSFKDCEGAARKNL